MIAHLALVRTHLRRAALLVCLAGAEALWAQSLLPDRGQSDRGGLTLYSLSAFSAYYPNTMGDRGYVPGMDLGGDVQMGGSATMGWSRTGSRSNIRLVYTPTYMARARHLEWNTLNHQFSLQGDRNLSSKWTAGFSAAGSVSSFEQFFLAPAAFGTVASPPATLSELAGAMLAGQFTSDQLASILTGAPLIESPTRQVFFGDRTLSSALQGTISYKRSSRLTISATLGAWRQQALRNGKDESPASSYGIAGSTSGSAGLRVQYSLSPRTQIGLSTNTSRTFSAIQDAYTTYFDAYIGRNMGRRWFLQAHAGGGFLRPVRQTYKIPTNPQFIAGGSLGYNNRAHTFTVSCNRTVGDLYGFGASSTTSTSAGWRWLRPGRNWWVDGSFNHQRMTGSWFGNSNSWSVVARTGRRLNRQTELVAHFIHVNYSGGAYNYSRSAVGGALIWFPNLTLAK